MPASRLFSSSPILPLVTEGVDQGCNTKIVERESFEGRGAGEAGSTTSGKPVAHGGTSTAGRRSTLQDRSQLENWKVQCAASKSDGVDRNFLKLPSTAQPDELCFFGIELESV